MDDIGMVTCHAPGVFVWFKLWHGISWVIYVDKQAT